MKSRCENEANFWYVSKIVFMKKIVQNEALISRSDFVKIDDFVMNSIFKVLQKIFYSSYRHIQGIYKVALHWWKNQEHRRRLEKNIGKNELGGENHPLFPPILISLPNLTTCYFEMQKFFSLILTSWKSEKLKNMKIGFVASSAQNGW